MTTTFGPEDIIINQKVAILIDGNNIERSLHTITGNEGVMLNFDLIVPKLLETRALNRLVYFREGKRISSKLAERLHNHYYGSVVPCHKSADIPLSIMATQLASKVDTIVIMSGDADYIELVRHLKSEGVRVEIAAVAETTANILIEECNYFHPLNSDDWYLLSHQKKRFTKNP
ncbi:MAG: NYN domain-containing protein [Oligoflexales bacterium]|nr:NYN domain-containing protein [Oligoflexales bacterium]